MLMSLNHRLRRHAGVALIALTGLGLASCSGDEPPVADTTTQDTDGTVEVVAASDGAVEVSLVDFAFVGLPSAVPSGTRLSVVNDAEAELHELVAFRLLEDEGRPVDELARLTPPELIEALGEPVTVLLAEPGGEQIPAVGDGTLVTPGRYAVMCFIPTGVEPQVYLAAAAEADDGPPRVEGGPPHFVRGMVAELTVQ
jgi:hypothetical protein